MGKEWVFWDHGTDRSPYEDVYDRTRREDWISVVREMAQVLSGKKKLIDVGSGDGHSTRQILERVKDGAICDLLEPNETALRKSLEYLSMFGYRIKDIFPVGLADFKPTKRYDGIFTVHTNYYWASDEQGYGRCLDKLLIMLGEGGVLQVLTLPKDSDHYNVAIEEIYPKYVNPEHMMVHFRKSGHKVDIKQFPARLYVGDLKDDKLALATFFGFIHNSTRAPTEAQTQRFLERIGKYEKGGYLNFKDNLVLVTR